MGGLCFDVLIVVIRYIVPHQPRLDWQMWFAALGSYQHNPWLLNLVYRLLMNERDGVYVYSTIKYSNTCVVP